MVGQSLGHYRIEARLGAGGMGIVYLARDTRLDRPVALKLVGDKASLDPLSRDDLLREGRAASALNHPNICTLHGVEEADGQLFIVMEYIEGSPLNTVVPSGGLPLELVLRYGIQVADGLEHAHERGVTHRDLKSANVIVTPEGRAKVVDFGLARRATRDHAADASTKTIPAPEGQTVLVGTLSYLAPEVLRGAPASASSDIWSLGVVLYEIATGQLPFEGTNAFDLSAAILRAPTAPLPAHVPPALRTIIQRCLAKEPGQRYRRAGEVRAALEAIESSVQFTPDTEEAQAAGSQWRWVAATAALSGTALVFLLLWQAPRPPRSGIPGAGQLRLAVSSERRAFNPTISPDGRMIAYVAEATDGRLDLFVGDARGEGQIRLTEDDAHEAEPQFSPDGTRLVFARRRTGSASSEICIIPALGGQVLTVVARAGSPAWSPDGERLAFVHQPTVDAPIVLATANADGSDLQVVLQADGTFPFPRGPAWSPDGTEIAFIRGSGGVAGELWIVSADGKGPPRRLSNDPVSVSSEDPVFTPDGNGVIHSSNRGGATNLWMHPRDGGVPVRLTTGSGPDESPSIARDGTLVFSNSRWRNVLLVHELATEITRLLLTHTPFLWAPAFSPNGRELVYSQGEVDGSWHLWVVPTAGGNARRLTTTTQGEVYPRFTPDGGTITFQTWNEPRHIWHVPSTGGPPTMLPISQMEGDAYADVSPDGVWVAFARPEAQAEFIYVAPMSGGAARRLSEQPGSVPQWSPNGQWIAFSLNRGYSGGVFVTRSDGSELRRLTDRGGWPVWWPDGTQIAYLAVGEDGHQVIEVTPVAGGPPRRLDTLRFNGTNHPIAISPDGALIATSDSIHISDEIWLLGPG